MTEIFTYVYAYLSIYLSISVIFSSLSAHIHRYTHPNMYTRVSVCVTKVHPTSTYCTQRNTFSNEICNLADSVTCAPFMNFE